MLLVCDFARYFLFGADLGMLRRPIVNDLYVLVTNAVVRGLAERDTCLVSACHDPTIENSPVYVVP